MSLICRNNKCESSQELLELLLTFFPCPVSSLGMIPFDLHGVKCTCIWKNLSTYFEVFVIVFNTNKVKILCHFTIDNLFPEIMPLWEVIQIILRTFHIHQHKELFSQIQEIDQWIFSVNPGPENGEMISVFNWCYQPKLNICWCHQSFMRSDKRYK